MSSTEYNFWDDRTHELEQDNHPCKGCTDFMDGECISNGACGRTTRENQIDNVLLKFGVTKEPMQENAAEELESTLTDYHQLSQQYSDLVTKFCYAIKPIKKNDVWCCPGCEKRIAYHHSHCHWCGKKITWW